MKQKIESVIRNKKVAIALMEILVAIGCIVIFCLLMTPKDRVLETTYSFSKVEDVTEYKVVNNYITRVMPLTTYETFKEIAENTLNNASENNMYTVKVYRDAEKTEEITEGYIASGMVVEAIAKADTDAEEVVKEGEVLDGEETQETVDEEKMTGELEGNEITNEKKEENQATETKETTGEVQEGTNEIEGEGKEDEKEISSDEGSNEVSYIISVLGDITKDGDINITELTKMIKHVVGLSQWNFAEEEKLSADLSGDDEINVVDINLCINYIVFGELELEEPEYTITFKNYDGTIISTKTDYHYGDIVEIPENPTREADDKYTYQFEGWVPVISDKVTKDEIYVATYKAVEIKTEAIYKVEHYKEKLNEPREETEDEKLEENYELVETEELVGRIGEEVTAIAKEYTGFSEDTENENRIVNGIISGEEELVLKLFYKRNSYTVTFKDDDGTVISEATYYYEEDIKVPSENPTKEADNTYTYEFAGWDKEITTVKEDVEYTAVYTNKYIEYTIIFKNDNGNIINSTVYHYGDTIEKPQDPAKESTIEYAYKFTGWTPEVEEIVTENAEYIATYEEQEINYNIIFYNDDGITEVARIENYTLGDDFSLPPAPTKESTEEIKYVFYAWNNLGLEEITETQKILKLVAKYKEEYFVARVEATEILEGVSYLTLEEAVENAGSEPRIIRLLRDTQETVMIEDNQNITLNLNGRTITGTKDYAIKNYGELIVTDDTEEKEGKIVNNVSNGVGFGIYNRDGKVIIKSGTIATETTQESGATYGIYNQSEQALIIEGGSIIAEAKGETAISAGIYNLAGKEIVVTGGLVSGKATGDNTTSYGIYNETSQDVMINGGTIVSQSDKNMAYGIYNKEGKINVVSGTIEVAALTGYGVYNEAGITDIQSGNIDVTANEGYTGIGIYNEANSELTLGVKDDIVNVTNPRIKGNTCGINNNSNAILNFYDGRVIGETTIEGNITKKEFGYMTVTSTYNETNLQVCYLEVIPDGTTLQATDENGITWNYTYQDRQATNVYYESGYLGTTVIIPASLDGYPVIDLYNSGNNIFSKWSFDNIKEVIITEGITDIGDYAFYNCWGITSVEVPSSVSYIGTYAFHTYSITDIYIDNVQSNLTLGTDWSYNATVHYRGCRHIITTNIVEEGLKLEEVSNNLVYGSIACRETYTFKVVDENGNIVKETKAHTTEKMTRNEEGIYIIDNIKRDISIEIGTSNGIAYQSTDENGITWNYTYQEGKATDVYYASGILGTKVVIPASLDGYPVENLCNPMGLDIFSTYNNTQYRGIVKQIVISEGITSIGTSAFDNCTSLVKAEIPSSVTNIGVAAFGNCSSLTSIEIPNSVTSIESYTFVSCGNLTSVEIPDSVTSIQSYAFQNCNALQSVNIPNSVVTIGEYAFVGSKDIYIDNIRSNITVGYGWCGSATVHYSKYSITKQVEEGLSINEVSGNVTDNLIARGETYSFKVLDGQDNVVTDKVVKITKAIVRYSVNTEIVEYIENIQEPNEDGVYTIENIQNDIIICVGIAEGGTYQATDENGITWNYTLLNGEATDVHMVSGELGETVIIPSTLNGYPVVKLYKGSYEGGYYVGGNIIGLRKTTKVIIPETVTVIGSEAFDEKSRNGSILTDIYIDNDSTNVYSQYGGYFQHSANVHYRGCTHSITKEVIEGAIIEDVTNNLGEEGTSIGCREEYKFRLVDESGNIQKYKEVKIKLDGIGQYILPDAEGIYTIKCDSKNIVIGAVGIEKWDQCLATDENGITWKYTYRDGKATDVCYESGELGETVIIPNKLSAGENEYPVESISGKYDDYYGMHSNMFEKGDYHKITKIIISEGITNIGYCAFWNCNNFISITIPSSVTSIGTYAFPVGYSISINVSVSSEANITDFIWNLINTNVIIENINVDENNPDYSSENGILYDKQKTTLIKCPLGKKGEVDIAEGVIAISGGALSNCTGITSVTIPSSITDITLGDSFWNASNLENINVDENNPNYSSENGILYNKEKTVLVKCPIGRKGEVNIPSTVTKIDDNAFYGCTGLTNVNIPDGVTTIGNSAFIRCTGLTSVIIPEGVTIIEDNTFAGCGLMSINIPNSVITIGADAFDACSSLKNVIIPNSVTTIEDTAFAHCYGLTSIEIPNSVTNIGIRAFYECINLTDIYVNNIETNMSLGYDWSYSATVHYKECRHPISYDIWEDGIKLEEVSGNLVDYTIGCRQTYTFKLLDEQGNVLTDKQVIAYTQGIEQYITPNEDGVYKIENVKSSVYMAIGKYPINHDEGMSYQATDENGITWRYIYQGGFATAVEYVSGELIGTVTIPSELDGYPVVTLSNIFSTGDYSKITKIIIPEGVVEVGSSAFSGCTTLQSVDIPSTLQNIEYLTFSGCVSLENININKDNPYCSSIDGVLYNKEGTVLRRCPAGKKGELNIPEGVVQILAYIDGQTGYSAFENCNNLKSINIPSSVANIGDCAFISCSNLTDIYIDNEYSNMTFGWCWYGSAKVHYKGCTHTIEKETEEGIQIIDVTDNVNDGRIVCRQEYKFKIVDKNGKILKDRKVKKTLEIISEYITPDENGIYTIDEVNKDTTISIEEPKNGEIFIATDENGITWQYIYLEGKAINVNYYSGELGETVTIPETLNGCQVVNLNSRRTESNGNLFNGAYNAIKQIIIPDSIINIGTYAFANCRALTEVYIGNSIEQISSYAFSNCTALTDVYIGNNVKQINSYAFTNCTSLTDIYICNSVKEISDYAFSNCSKLSDIYVNSTKADCKINYYLGRLNATKHYSDCEHTIANYISSERVVVECGSTYQFKIVDENGQVILGQEVIVRTGNIANIITPNEEGIYRVEAVNKNIEITMQTTTGKIVQIVQ